MSILSHPESLVDSPVDCKLSEPQRLFGQFTFGDIPGNNRCPCNQACHVDDRRYTQGDMDLPASFRNTHGFEVLDTFSPLDLFENLLAFIMAVGWGQYCDIPADNLSGGVIENFFCSFIPAGDSAIC